MSNRARSKSADQVRRLALSLILLLLAGAPARAQTDTTRFDRLWGADYDGPRRLEISVAGGYALSTDWSDRVALQVFDAQGGVHEQVLLRSVAVAPDAGVGGAVTYWRGRHGFRVGAGFSRSCLTTASRCADDDAGSDGPNATAPGGAALSVAGVPLNVWHYGAEGVVGLRNWTDSRVWRPYLVLGAGGVTYDPKGHALPLLSGQYETVLPPGGSSGGIVITDGHTTFLVETSELGLEHVFGLTIGAGMDLRVPIGIGGAGLRLEVADRITSSPFSVRVSRLDLDGRRYRGFDGDGFKSEPRAVHNLRLTAGLVLEFGLSGPRTEQLASYE